MKELKKLRITQRNCSRSSVEKAHGTFAVHLAEVFSATSFRK
jgi:hypothetical protein